MKPIKLFIYSAGGILFVAALIRFLIAAGGAQVLASPEPLIGIPLRYAVLTVGAFELLVALICLFGKHLLFQIGWLAWLSADFLVYRIGLLLGASPASRHLPRHPHRPAPPHPRNHGRRSLQSCHIYLLAGQLRGGDLVLARRRNQNDPKNVLPRLRRENQFCRPKRRPANPVPALPENPHPPSARNLENVLHLLQRPHRVPLPRPRPENPLPPLRNGRHLQGTAMNSKLNYIENWPELAQEAKWCAATLAKKCGVSERTLERHFLKHFGESPRIWLTKQRLGLAI